MSAEVIDGSSDDATDGSRALSAGTTDDQHGPDGPGDAGGSGPGPFGSLANGSANGSAQPDQRDLTDVPGACLTLHAPRISPLFRAQHESRYLRRDFIRAYQAKHNCRLAVMIDFIHPDCPTFLAELLHDADPKKDLHLMLRSPGGDGEVAVRLARMAQAACQRLVLVVPDIAKSAGTIFGLGAHEIVMGPTSDLGPIDPQIVVPQHGYIGAKEVIAAVDNALEDASQRQHTAGLHAALLGAGNITAATYQFAKSALTRTGDLAKQAVSSNPDRTATEVTKLCAKVEKHLITTPQMHSAVVGSVEARKVGLRITELEHHSQWWQDIWEIWIHYFAMGNLDDLMIYESEQASQVRRIQQQG